MDGRNSSGRTISLLNSDQAGAYLHKTQRPAISTQSQSSSTSRTSTPSPSPQTPYPPGLVRSDSSDSTGFRSPSFEQPLRQQYYIRHQSYRKMDDQNASMYPPLPDAASAMASAYPMPAPIQMQQHLPQALQQQIIYRPASTSPISEPSHMSTVSSAAQNKAQQKKNQYPCPLAKQVGCNDYFTTSGHAARHAKKHTGKKDAFCPECNKAFTRKDNMEQHRRTHQNGRGAPRSNNGDTSKVKKPASKAPLKKTAVKVEPQFEAAVEQQLVEQQLAGQQQEQLAMQALPQALPMPQNMNIQQALIDQALMMPPAGPYFIGNGMDTGPVPALPMAMPDLAGRPPLLRNSFATSLEYIPPAPSMMADPDALHYSYPSPGLSNGLNIRTGRFRESRHARKRPKAQPVLA
ncbi:hypothetical protein LTR53_015406 [Teratosphaeriaceae sp. CCFEE 6253]|nr:hypothetical protein LTR53_015406 [Teratosphaeriaceae sp. CCFEE 6253]